MKRFLVTAAVALVLIAAWTGLVGYGALEGWGRKPIAPRGDAQAFAAAAVERIRAAEPGNVAFVLLDDGRVAASYFASAGERVNADTLFQVASLSKWATAIGVMTLVEDGRLDLDAPVSRYLKRWTLPDGEFDERQVTVRRLLSHTAGLTDGLGYGGFAPGEPVQSLEASLTRAVDASPGADGRVRMGAEAGGFAYSGGGYALLQLLVEEVSGEPFALYMEREVLRPFGMARSTFVLNTAENVAQSFDAEGRTEPLRSFSAPAAASLYTSAADLTRLLQAHRPGPDGAPAGRGVLRPKTLAAMRAPTARQYGAEIWGLGVVLYAPNGAGDYVIGHDGLNAPAINTTARIDPATGDGVILLESGSPRLATEIGGAHTFWSTGRPDLFTLMRDARTILIVAAAGWIVILLAATASLYLGRRRR